MKGFSAVVHVAKKFPQMTMLVAVRGAVPDEIEQLSNVRVFHNATYDLLPLLYNAADFSMCPSRYDPFPFVVSEALASGTPVIASPHGASLTFYNEVDLKPLLVSSTDDLAGFEHAVQQVLADPQGWRELIQAKVRPRLEEMMAPENWWSRFQRVVGM
jgi:glycosyltransferase involved in cell wall biosynthesis